MSRSAEFALLLLIGLALGLAFQGSRGLYETTEGRYAEVGREMLETGHWLEPQLDYTPHWTKPPVTYWTVAAGLAALGRNAWGARLANALAFALTGLVVAALGRQLWDDRLTGFLAGAIYLTSLFPFVGAAVLSTDTLLVLAEALAILAYVRAWTSGGRRAAVLAMWMAFGVAFMIKGPPGLLPLLALLVFHVRAGRPFRMADPLAIAAAIVAGLWWYVLECALHPGLLSYFLGEEIVARNLTDRFGRNPQWWAPFVIYLPVLLLAPGTWFIDALAVARRRGLLRARGWRDAVSDRRSPGTLLLLLFVIPLAVLSLSRSRLPLYVLPLYVPAAVAIARGIVMRRTDARRYVLRLAGVTMVLLVGAKALAPRYRSDSDMKRLATTLAPIATDAHVIAFGETRLYGLQFYLDGALSRTASQQAGGPPITLTRLNADATSLARRPVVILARGHHATTLDEVLAASTAPVLRCRSGRWRIRAVGLAYEPAVPQCTGDPIP